MSSVILVVHLFFALSIIGLVLLQRSEGGGLGIGGSGGGLGGFATPQGTANILTRATAICATGFFITSLTLGAIAGHHRASTGILDTLDAPAATSSAPKVTSSSPEAPGRSGPTGRSHRRPNRMRAPARRSRRRPIRNPCRKRRRPRRFRNKSGPTRL